MVGLDAGAEEPTAVFFDEQTEDALEDAMLRFEAEADRFRPAALRERASRFDRPLFRERLREYIEARWAEFVERRGC
jgi:hypothetical protein